MADGRPPVIPGPVETAVLLWRWLRRMRTALYLLAALAAATFIGTVIPQRPNVPDTVARWRAGMEGPGRTASEVLDALGFFDVFGAPWFLVLLVLLFTSLTACLIPRVRAFVRMARRGRPPRALDLAGQPYHRSFVTAAAPAEALAAARDVLRQRRFRLRQDRDVVHEAAPVRSDPRLGVVAAPAEEHTAAVIAPAATRTDQVAAEKGHLLREGGSLVFHLAFYLLLIGVVIGELTTFIGQVAVVEGESFADTRVAYWTTDPGRWWDDDRHTAFVLHLDRFEVDWLPDGTPSLFRAHVEVDPSGDRPARRDAILVNAPMVVDGMKIHVLDWGYAVRMVVRDGDDVVHDAFTPLRQAGPGVWSGVVKAPAADPQLGFEIDLFADAPVGADGVPRPTGSPRADHPVVLFRAWRGDLQLDRAQNVSTLDTDELDQLGIAGLRPGSVYELGGGQTIEFGELRRWAGFQVSRRPTAPVLLLAGALILGGLLPALYAHRRRVWVAAHTDAATGGSLVTVAGAAFQRPQAFDDEFPRIVAAINDRLQDVGSAEAGRHREVARK